MTFELIHEQRFKYSEAGNGTVLVLLHGLFGTLSNFSRLIQHFSAKYRVAIPMLPLYELAPDKTTVDSMVDYVDEFIRFKKFDKVHLIGNSLGGHIAQLYALRRPQQVKTITLTGSSGLFENSLGDTYPRKGNYEYVKKKTESTFYDARLASKELVDEVFSLVNDRGKAIRIVTLAKSALRHNLRNLLPTLRLPVCLVWGREDSVTPVFVSEEFYKLLPDSELNIIEHCGHAPMMEKPGEFNEILERFLEKHE